MATRKEDEIQIPESVLNRANRSAIEASYGITGQERDRYNIPKFPSFGGSTFLNPNPQFGFATSTMLDQGLPATRMEERAVDYSRDSGTRMANRYTMPVSDLGVSDFRSGGFRTQLPTSRVGATAYSNPEMASNLERERSAYINPTQGVGQSGFGREYTFGNREVQQIVSPYGFASTTLTPQQVEQRSQVRQQAEQMGTMPRTPEQQQDLLAQMRQRGAAIGRDIVQRNEEVFGAKRAERKLVNDMVDKAVASGFTEPEAKAMARPYYQSQPSSIAGIQRDFANYQGAGVNAMTNFVQNNIRGMFPSDMGSRREAVASAPIASQPVAGGPQPKQRIRITSSPFGFGVPDFLDL